MSNENTQNPGIRPAEAHSGTLPEEARNSANETTEARETALRAFAAELKRKDDEEAPEIFRLEALYKGMPVVYVAETMDDAVALMEISRGDEALALNDPENILPLLRTLQKKKTSSTMILILGSDWKRDQLADGLQRLNVPFTVADIGSPYERWDTDRKRLYEDIQEAKVPAQKPESVSMYITAQLQNDIRKMKAAANKKTGFAHLDEQAGGIYPGLYVLAATSSLGKTTFALQLADNLAGAGNDVLFFSLEQSRLELVCKSIARTVYARSGKDITSLQIRTGYQAEEVTEAISAYSAAVGNRLNIIEGNFSCNAAYIREYIRKYVARNRCRPVIFIDYLQILQPEEDRKASVRETVDKIITDLKRLSRELDLTIFVISSVNRTNYLTPIDFESLKESGGIEYTADVVWGLQLRCLNDDLFSTDSKNKVGEKRERIRAEKAKEPRELELVCLKNRYGISSYSVNLDYYPRNDYFREHVYDGFQAAPADVPFDDWI